MKLIIAGSRTFYDPNFLSQCLKSINKPTEVVCGMARGADLLGKEWAISQDIPVKEFPANWNELGKSAGFIRNKEMGNYGDELAAFWDGKSRGTMNMILIMKYLKKPVHIFRY